MKLWVIQNFLTFGSMDSVTIHWKAVEQYFTVLLFVFQFYSVCNFRKFVNSGLGTIRSERVKENERMRRGCKPKDVMFCV